MTTRKGCKTAIARKAFSFKSSRMQYSKTPISIHEFCLVTPMRSQKSRIDFGVKPALRKPAIVGIRGSSQPCTCFSMTS